MSAYRNLMPGKTFLLPFRVVYDRQFSHWHEKAQPSIVDANGHVVCYMQQNVNHPGEYDEQADKFACLFVEAANKGV